MIVGYNEDNNLAYIKEATSRKKTYPWAVKVVQLLPHRVSIRFECNLYVFCVVFRVTDPTLHNVLFKDRLLHYCYKMVLVGITR